MVTVVEGWKRERDWTLKPISPTRLWLAGLVQEQAFQGVVVMAVLLALLIIIGRL